MCIRMHSPYTWLLFLLWFFSDAEINIVAAKDSGAVPLLPRSVHAFMYLWYGEPKTDGGVYKHWNHEVLPHWEPRINEQYSEVGSRFTPPYDIHSPFYPLHGPYSSSDKQVLLRQFDELTSAGVEVAVVSWWGPKDKPHATDTQGVNTDLVLANLLREADAYNSVQAALHEAEGGIGQAKSIKISLHLEPYPTRSAASIRTDLDYIAKEYSHHSCLYKGTDGRRVYYVYDSYHIPSSQWSRLLDVEGDLSVRGTPSDGIMLGLWLHHHHGRDLREGKFDGFYTYFGTDGFSYGSTTVNWNHMCRFAAKANLLCCLSVGPGYNDTLIRPWNFLNTRDRNGGKYYESMWQQALKAKPATISVTSYNEWGEGTQIEPSKSFHLRNIKRERMTADDGKQRRTVGVSAEQLRNGVDIEDISKDLEELTSLEGVELYSTPFADVVIGNKAAGMRDDARSIEDMRSGTRSAFGGAGYYDEGDSNGDGIADSGGGLMDSFKDDRNQTEREKHREHVTTQMLQKLRLQKEALDAYEAVHQQGIDLQHVKEWTRLQRTYVDYGVEGPYFYLQKTKQLSDKFIGVASTREKSSGGS